MIKYEFFNHELCKLENPKLRPVIVWLVLDRFFIKVVVNQIRLSRHSVYEEKRGM